MLIMYGYRHLTKKRQKDEDFAFDETFSVENNDRKRTVERRKLIFKTNVC